MAEEGGGGGKWREPGRKPKSVHGTANEPFLAMALRVGVDVIHHFLGYRPYPLCLRRRRDERERVRLTSQQDRENCTAGEKFRR